jgi:hypothetical protein
MDYIKYWFSSAVEAQNFPAWELYVLFTLLLMISIILRLRNIQKQLDEHNKEMIDILIGE